MSELQVILAQVNLVLAKVYAAMNELDMADKQLCQLRDVLQQKIDKIDADLSKENDNGNV